MVDSRLWTDDRMHDCVRSRRACGVTFTTTNSSTQSEKTLVNAVAAMEKLKYNVFADPELYASSQLPSPALPVRAAGTSSEMTELGYIFPDETSANDAVCRLGRRLAGPSSWPAA